MRIESTLINRSQQILKVIYQESDPLQDLEGRFLQSVRAYCFYKGKLVIVFAREKGSWAPPGGGIEHGEGYIEAIVREVAEETNMKVLYQELIGYQDVFEPNRIVRQIVSFCVVEPMGKFVTDPDGDITEIKLIDPKDYKKYFDWGMVGDRVMSRALQIKEEMG